MLCCGSQMSAQDQHTKVYLLNNRLVVGGSFLKKLNFFSAIIFFGLHNIPPDTFQPSHA